MRPYLQVQTCCLTCGPFNLTDKGVYDKAQIKLEKYGKTMQVQSKNMDWCVISAQPATTICSSTPITLNVFSIGQD